MIYTFNYNFTHTVISYVMIKQFSYMCRE